MGRAIEQEEQHSRSRTHQVVQQAEEGNAAEHESDYYLSLHVIFVRAVPDARGVHHLLVGVPVIRTDITQTRALVHVTRRQGRC